MLSEAVDEGWIKVNVLKTHFHFRPSLTKYIENIMFWIKNLLQKLDRFWTSCVAHATRLVQSKIKRSVSSFCGGSGGLPGILFNVALWSGSATDYCSSVLFLGNNFLTI